MFFKIRKKITKIFSSFMSRWTMFSECKYDMAVVNCDISDFVSDSMYFTLFVKSSNKSPPF